MGSTTKGGRERELAEFQSEGGVRDDVGAGVLRVVGAKWDRREALAVAFATSVEDFVLLDTGVCWLGLKQRRAEVVNPNIGLALARAARDRLDLVDTQGVPAVVATEGIGSADQAFDRGLAAPRSGGCSAALGVAGLLTGAARDGFDLVRTDTPVRVPDELGTTVPTC